jgi:TetR/AcrR family transcriptional regulator, regulator of cefoperazone and chloramphenicol sensitivity
MKIRREDSTRTRERLIAAASEVFSEKDYSIATIAEICDRAGANIAAVNYHFGDKETLYREAWRNAFRASLERYPEDGGISDDAPAEERLRGLVVAFLNRVRDESNRGFFIALRELTSPTGLLEEVTDTEVRPIHRRMESIVRDLLSPDSSKADLQFCTISILNQCFSPILAKRPEPSTEKPNKPFPPRISDIDAYADQVVRFSLGGIRAIVEAVGQTPPKLNGREKKGVK